MRGKVGQLNILTCQISYPYFQRFGLASVHRPTDKQTNKLTVLTISITLTAYVQYSVMCQGSEVSSENQLRPTCRRMTVPKTWYDNELNMINPCNYNWLLKHIHGEDLACHNRVGRQSMLLTIPVTVALPNTSWKACRTPATLTSLTEVTTTSMSPPESKKNTKYSVFDAQGN